MTDQKYMVHVTFQRYHNSRRVTRIVFYMVGNQFPSMGYTIVPTIENMGPVIVHEVFVNPV